MALPALAMMAVRVTALLALAMVSLAPALLVLALGLVLVLVLAPLALPALVLAGTRVRRLEQLKTRRTRQRDEAPGLVRGQQQLPHLQGAAAAAAA